MGAVEREQLDSLDKLKNFLSSVGIEIFEWGSGVAKTVEHLYSEIQRGESVLVRGEQGEIVRRVRIAGVDIYYSTPEGNILRLIEDRQVFPDGRVRRRDYDHAVSEKLKPEEEPLEGAIRGIQEELGIISEIDVEELEREMLSADYLLAIPVYLVNISDFITGWN